MHQRLVREFWTMGIVHALTPRKRVDLTRSTGAEGDTALGKVVGSELNRNFVAGKDADVVFTHPSRDVGGNDMSVLELYSERGIGKGFNDRSLHFDMIFFGHAAY